MKTTNEQILHLPNKGLFSNLKSDFPASVVVFLVATPLCLGIALASGAPLFAGIIAGIVGGIVVGATSGSALGVSGPAAGLAVIVLNAITQLGVWETFLLAVMLAGVIQIIFGFLRAGIIGYYFPSSVIKGMLSGIGLIIILKQIPHAFGYDEVPEGSLKFLQIDSYNTLSELLHLFSFIDPGALVVTLVSLGILILWERPFMKTKKWLQWVQGPLVAVTAGILLNEAFKVFIPALTIQSTHLVQIPVAGSLSGFLGLFTLPDFSQITNAAVYTTAITLAVVASLETLLCVEATDNMDPHKRITPTNRELKAQGLGNLISGFIGGLPITQVIVRSSANNQSGGKTKASAILHGFMLLFAALLIPNILNMIPLACLAAILIVVGYKLAKPALFKTMYRLGWYQFTPFMVTILGILFTDLLVGIGLGMAVAIFFVLINNFSNPYFIPNEPHKPGELIRIQLADEVTFLNRASIMRTLDEIPPHTKVEIDATRSVNIDYDVYEIIKNFEETARLRDIDLTLKGLTLGQRNDAVRRVKRVIRRERRRIAKVKEEQMN
jgi:MFS superfamily sulfate permease-like transporter